MRLKALCILLFGIAIVRADAAELKGHVVGYAKEVVQIAVEGNQVPQPGDEVEVYIQIPGIEDTAWVCSAKVTRVENDIVSAQVTEKSADPRKDDLAQITSQHPVPKRGR